MPQPSLGQIAYEAYGEHQEWLTFRGDLMPSFDSQRADITAAWEAAAKAVARHLRKQRDRED